MRQIMAVLICAFLSLFGQVELSAAQGANFLELFDDWSIYEFKQGNRKLCFAVSQPKDSEPKEIERSDTYFYISSWPSEGVTNEVSIKIGYDFADGSTVTVQIGSVDFELFTDGDKAFVETTARERRLVNAMRRGSKMVVKGRSVQGTDTSDVYSLFGVTAAIRYLAQICR